MEGSRSDKRNKGRTTIVANFHTFNATGADIPAGTATMDILFDAVGNDVWSSSVKGNQLFPGNVVTFAR
jgi:hypothetical protein